MTTAYSYRNVIEILNHLPANLQQEISDFAEFVAKKYIPAKQEKNKKSGFGRAKGQIIMTKDFDEPLYDIFKEYMPVIIK